VVHWNESAMFEQLRLDGSYETPDLVEAALDADADITPISKMTIEPKAEPSKSNLKRIPSNPLQRRANGWSEPPTSHPLSKSMRAGSIVEPEVPLEPIRTDVENNKEELEEQSADESGAEEYTDEVEPLSNANMHSAQETSFMGDSYKVTLSTIHIPPHQCPQRHTVLGATALRLRATMTIYLRT
jgi:hypothetical protein